MSVKFKLNKSGMRKLEKQLKKDVMNNVDHQLRTSSYEYTCPNCKKLTNVKVGSNTCHFCGQNIEVTLDL